MAIVKADAKKTFENVGKNAVQDAQIRAAGNTVIGKKVAGAGRTVGDTFKTPRASAAEFAPESTAFRTAEDTGAGVKVSRGAKNETSYLAKKTENDISQVIDEAPTPKGKTAIERTKVARLNERAATLRNKVAKAIEDSKRAADDGVTLDKDPFDDIDNEVTNFKKEFEALTGEKAPSDPDELIARIKGIEGENKVAWLKEDRNVTRRKELAAMGGVRRLPGYARGSKTARGIKGRSGAKFAGKKGVFTEARTKQLIKQDNENYKKSLLASISQRQADIRKEIASESTKPKIDFDKITRLQEELDNDLPLMHKDIRTGKVSEEDLYEMGKDFATKGRDPFKIQLQGEKNGILPSKNNAQFNSLPLKKDDGAIRQIATAEVSGAKQASAVIDGGGNVPRGTKPAVSEIPPMPKQGAVKSWVDKVGTNMREVIQDNWIRVKKLQENPNAKIDTNKLTPYEAETLFHGRVGHRLSTATDTLKTIDKTIADAEKALKRPELRKDIDKYLVAKHAPERNALHGDGASGMTTQEADDIVKAFEGDKANEGAMKIAQDIKKTNEQTLDILHDSQVIDDETFKTLRETYKNHIPLNRIMGDTEDMGGALVGKGYDVKSSGIKRAKGSDKEVADILTNVGANLEQAIVRAEKNRVNLATLNFARENKHLGVFEEIKPQAIGETFDGKPIMKQITDPLVLTVRENGKPVYLRIKDEKLAQAFKGIGNEKLPPVLSFISGFTRMYSGLATRFNPEFAFSNKLRDLQEMSIYMSSQKGIGFSGAGKTVTRDIFSIKDVVDFKRGGNSEGAKLYKQMMEDGGTTGGQALSTRKQLEIDLEAIRRINRGGKFNMRANGKKIIEAFDSWNEVFEDSTRLSTYKTALDKGMSREQAAIIAKNATLNFNKKGTGGPVINGMYMFANASIQGSTKLLKSMKDPKTAAAVVTAVTASVAATNSWNDSVDPEWRKKVSEWDRNSNLVVMLPGGGAGAKYMTIPVSWGIKPIKVMADYGMDALAGKADQNTGLDVAGKVMSSLWNAYNPVGGTDLTSAAVPSFLDIPVEVARNQKWSGSAMRPDDKEGVPASEAFFQNKQGVPSDKSKIFGVLRQGTKFLADKSGGQIEINPANLKYALDGYLSGLGRFGTGAVETGLAASKGELPQASDAPFSRRFYKTKTEEEITKAQSYSEKDDLYANLK
ncbi:MAG: LPD38 domain-containing protein, partial [Kiritimatiellales bacterium]